jgi:glutaredoxin
VTTDKKTETNTPEKGSVNAGNTPVQPIFSKSTLVAIIGIAAVIVILLVYGVTQNVPGQVTVVPLKTCAEKTILYINNNLVSPGTSATLANVSENRGIYDITIVYQGRDMIIHTTRDCSTLFTSSIDMNATAAASQTRPSQPAAAPVKTDRPVVDLYVMAFCPYGTQAESAMKPVVSLLGSKADIRVRYITTVRGTSVASVQSLHGIPEAQEDLRQICILKKNPEKFWEYLGLFNDACYPQYQNADRLDACWKNVSARTGIDRTSIETCASSEEGLALLKADEVLSDKDGASASPTLMINGQEFRGSRTPDAYKQAICDHFVTPPSECTTTLPPVPGTVVSGDCG